ncbi:uncharacterized protein VTP21DRAFT_9756 [Calcarisporiella thermophila]|uniref:uncharacterized protein n=1 Tax=Calcarisporiella thermophila TaxID=911321 RepID=UPI003743CDE6
MMKSIVTIAAIVILSFASISKGHPVKNIETPNSVNHQNEDSESPNQIYASGMSPDLSANVGNNLDADVNGVLGLIRYPTGLIEESGAQASLLVSGGRGLSQKK